jgi:hypothetical protein
MEIKIQSLVKLCSIEFTDNPVSTLRLVQTVRTQRLGVPDLHSAANRSEILTIRHLLTCTLRVARFLGMMPHTFVHKSKNNSSVTNRGNKTAALFRLLPTHSV